MALSNIKRFLESLRIAALIFCLNYKQNSLSNPVFENIGVIRKTSAIPPDAAPI